MNELNQIPYSCKTQHLFLLIGTNPLPNFVATRLLVQPNGVVHLLHTPETGNFADSIKRQLEQYLPSAEYRLHEISGYDSTRIRHDIGRIARRLWEDLRGARDASVGLHYTGGSAVMSAHAYSIIEEVFPDAVFSYLNARTLSIQFDGRNGEPTRSIYAGRLCKVSLEELVQLHSHTKFKEEPKRFKASEFVRAIIQALLEINLTEEGFRAWGEYTRKAKDERYKSLPDLSSYPSLEPFVNVLHSLGENPTPADVVAAMERRAKKGLVSHREWFEGIWLEEYVLWELSRFAEEYPLHSYGQGMKVILRKSRTKYFELDVAAMHGYQLFAISCKASNNKDRCKLALLEAYVRARQLGGDEARVALVCLYDKARGFEVDVQEEWFAENRVRVFGPDELPSLSDHLREWIETASSGK